MKSNDGFVDAAADVDELSPFSSRSSSCPSSSSSALPGCAPRLGLTDLIGSCEPLVAVGVVVGRCVASDGLVLLPDGAKIACNRRSSSSSSAGAGCGVVTRLGATTGCFAGAGCGAGAGEGVTGATTGAGAGTAVAATGCFAGAGCGADAAEAGAPGCGTGGCGAGAGCCGTYWGARCSCEGDGLRVGRVVGACGCKFVLLERGVAGVVGRLRGTITGCGGCCCGGGVARFGPARIWFSNASSSSSATTLRAGGVTTTAVGTTGGGPVGALRFCPSKIC